jgi:hypothetical protein
MKRSRADAALRFMCAICVMGNSQTPVPAKLNTLGWLSGVDATSCNFRATEGYTCINHTVCADCLGEAKQTSRKCGPIGTNATDHRHVLVGADPDTDTKPEWICTAHRNHRAAVAAAASVSPCACDCHIDTGTSACKQASAATGKTRKKKGKRGPKPKITPAESVSNSLVSLFLLCF